MSELDLRKLFIEHEVVLRSETLPKRGTLDFVPASQGSSVFFRKHPEDVCYIIAVEGDQVLAIKSPQVTLPLVTYREGEQAVQDRLQAILEAVVNQGPGSLIAPAEQAVSSLIEQLGDHPLRAIIAGELAQLRLPAADWDQAPFFAYEGMQEDVLYGVTEAKRVGHIVTDVSTGAVGIICIGGIVSVKLAQD